MPILNEALIFLIELLKSWFIYLGLIPTAVGYLQTYQLIPGEIPPISDGLKSIVFFITFFIASFMIYYEKLKKLKSLSQNLPSYGLDKIEIARVTKKLKTINLKIESKTNDLSENDGLLTSISKLTRAMEQTLPKEYITAVENYNFSIGNYNKLIDVGLYSLKLSVLLTNKSDKNIEVELTSTGVGMFTDYDGLEIPEKPKEEDYNNFSILDQLDIYPKYNQLELNTPEIQDDKVIFSPMGEYNAGNKIILNDRSIYFLSIESNIKLNLKITSSNLKEPVILSEVINLDR